MKNSDIELRHTNDNSEPKRNIENSESARNNGNSQPEERPSTLLGKLRATIACLTIEPFLICYIFPISLSSIAIQSFNFEKACRATLGYSQYECDNWLGNTTVDVQKEVAAMTTWQIPLQSSLPAILILFVGVWSDRTGNRKALMMVPMFGELISAFGLILATYFFEEWPLFTTALIEALPSALCGGISIALMGSYSYLADVTTPENRTFRIGIAGVIVTLGAPLAIVFSGLILDAIGYYGVFAITTSMFVCGLLYTYYRVHDVKRVELEGTFYQKVIGFFSLRNPLETLKIAFKKSPNRTKIILVLAAHVVIIGPVFGEGAMQYQYMLLKFAMEDVEISLYFAYAIFVGICGTAVAMILFSKRLKMHDAIIGLIAATSKVISACVYGLAPNKAWYYSAPVFDFFGGSGVAAIRAMGTKVVDPDQVAKMCSLIGLVEAIVPVVYTPIYSQTYRNTIETFPGTFYLLGAAMTAPAIAIFATLYIRHKKEKRDTVTNPEIKEKYAHDNDVTTF